MVNGWRIDFDVHDWKNLGCLEQTVGRNMDVQGSAECTEGNEQLANGNWGKQILVLQYHGRKLSWVMPWSFMKSRTCKWSAWRSSWEYLHTMCWRCVLVPSCCLWQNSRGNSVCGLQLQCTAWSSSLPFPTACPSGTLWIAGLWRTMFVCLDGQTYVIHTGVWICSSVFNTLPLTITDLITVIQASM